MILAWRMQSAATDPELGTRLRSFELRRGRLATWPFRSEALLPLPGRSRFRLRAGLRKVRTPQGSVPRENGGRVSARSPDGKCSRKQTALLRPPGYEG